MKKPAEFFEDRLGVKPETNDEKLMCAMMGKYAEYCLVIRHEQIKKIFIKIWGEKK